MSPAPKSLTEFLHQRIINYVLSLLVGCRWFTQAIHEPRGECWTVNVIGVKEQ